MPVGVGGFVIGLVLGVLRLSDCLKQARVPWGGLGAELEAGQFVAEGLLGDHLEGGHLVGVGEGGTWCRRTIRDSSRRWVG